LTELPSSYFASNIYCTVFDDDLGMKWIDDVGIDNVLFEIDYPHGDSAWPDCLAVAQEQSAGLTEDQTEKFVRGNARRLFGLN
jgi:predicted TIM-barrel fold metal-dependent hydrolase